jgi:hypothetical protein
MKLTVRFAALLATTALTVAMLATIRAKAGSSSPPSSQQALRDLHRKMALGARWAGFASGSFVRARVHSVDASSGEGTYVRIEEISDRNDDVVVTTYWDAEHKEELGDMRYSLDAPDLINSKATRLEDDQVPVGNKLLTAQVYQFEKSFKVLYETRTITWTFWIAPAMPEGVLRRVTTETSTDPTYGDTDDEKLSALDVPFVVGRKTLHCYCRDSEDKYIGGKVERLRICYNSSVPGGVVKKDVRVTENGKETIRQDYALIDYHVER